MGPGYQGLSTGRVLAAIVIVSLLSSTATAVAVQSLSFNPIVPGTGPLESSGDIVLEDQDLQYTGTKVDAVDTTINNTGSSTHDVDVHVALRDESGGVLVEKTVSTSVGASTVKTVTADFAQSNEPSVNDVEDVEITLEVTA